MNVNAVPQVAFVAKDFLVEIIGLVLISVDDLEPIRQDAAQCIDFSSFWRSNSKLAGSSCAIQSSRFTRMTLIPPSFLRKALFSSSNC